ncbi:MAG: AraC family ligand binding domain-containing protein [Verrucomicrobiae bacterium]|nr:AraC family ligand binding domain-containing protein [Verrucomicrobiae bacterium]
MPCRYPRTFASPTPRRSRRTAAKWCTSATGTKPTPARYRFDNWSREKFSLLQWTVSGEGCFRAAQEYWLRAGQAFLVNSPSATAYWLPPGRWWEFYWVLFVGDMAHWHVEQLINRQGHIFEGPLPEALRQTYDEVVAGKTPDRYTLCARMYQILMHLYRGAETADDPVERAVRVIYRQYADAALAVPDLAAAPFVRVSLCADLSGADGEKSVGIRPTRTHGTRA